MTPMTEPQREFSSLRHELTRKRYEQARTVLVAARATDWWIDKYGHKSPCVPIDHVEWLFAYCDSVEARNAKLEAVAEAAGALANREGSDGKCTDCGLQGHLAPCPWTAIDAALDALDD